MSVATIFLVIFGVALFELYVALGETPGHLAAVAHRSLREPEELRPGRLTLGCRGAGQRNREALPNRSSFHVVSGEVGC